MQTFKPIGFLGEQGNCFGVIHGHLRESLLLAPAPLDFWVLVSSENVKEVGVYRARVHVVVVPRGYLRNRRCA
jgi:hypothetical protein